MKAVIFDFDGTLTKSKKGSNCWRKIWEYIDDLEYDDMLYTKFLNKKIDNKQWFNMIFKRYAEKNVNDKTMLNIANSIEMINDSYDVLKTLYEKDIKIFILSGGIRQIIEKVLQRENLIQFVTSIEAYDLIFDENGKLINYKTPIHNLENKSEYIEIVKQKFNLNSKEIIFIGNGKNDENAFQSGVTTLCINPDDADFSNKKVWNHTIKNCGSLKEILIFFN